MEHNKDCRADRLFASSVTELSNREYFTIHGLLQGTYFETPTSSLGRLSNPVVTGARLFLLATMFQTDVGDATVLLQVFRTARVH